MTALQRRHQKLQAQRRSIVINTTKDAVLALGVIASIGFMILHFA